MKIIYAVSGGIDSMCMADMYCHAGGDAAVAHCNFHLRGEESDADAELVRRWADEHGVEFFHADFDTEAYAREKRISIEMAARELRYNWFAELASKHGYDAVAVAHNANDNAETFFLNLIRGTGGKGLRGMQAESIIPGTGVPLLRPLLSMTRREIERYASEHNVPFREDRTNSDVIYRRNMLRHRILPVLKDLNPSFLQTLSRNMEHIAQENDIAEDYFIEARGKIFKDGRIHVQDLLSYKHWEYILFRITEPFSVSEETLRALIRLISDGNTTFAGKTFESPTHVLVTASDSIIITERKLMPDDDEMQINGPGTYHFHGRVIDIEVLDFNSDMPLKQPAEILIADADSLTFPMTLRAWKDGDWMHPFGMHGRRKKASDIFTDLKMSLPEKRQAIILHAASVDPEASHICAILGHRTDEALRITKGSTKCLRIVLR